LGQLFKEFHNFLLKKLSLNSQTYGFVIRDPRSGIRDPEKTYSGSRIQESKRHTAKKTVLTHGEYRDMIRKAGMKAQIKI
jgi:hypothetical protein